MTPRQTVSTVFQNRPPSNNDSEPPFLSPITARPCEGDLAYLCADYGCARKGGTWVQAWKAECGNWCRKIVAANLENSRNAEVITAQIA
jgi:hypothetical protein